ncbi:UNVERIFIED_CONTAM: Nuclear pore complex protein Nup85 [Siphonaria sp. JEL0065]|nr:Nuclear pore complex protein Nup85 [Siphonaria sp. JEL0065]
MAELAPRFVRELGLGGRGLGVSTRTTVLKRSKNQRGEIDSVLLALVAQITARARSTAEENLFVANELRLTEKHHAVHSAAVVWLLAESLLLEPPSQHLSSLLLVWINQLDPKPSQIEYSSILDSATASFPSNHALYWSYIQKCLLRGHFYAAATMIQKHEFFVASVDTSKSGGGSGSVYASLVSLIHAMPKAAAASVTNRAQFDVNWKAWRRSVLAYKDSHRLVAVFGRSEDIEQVAVCFGILAGDLEVLSQVCTSLQDDTTADLAWMEALVALIWYTDPFCSNTGVSGHLEELKSVLEIPTIPSSPSSMDQDLEEDVEQDEHDAFQLAIVALFDLQVDIAVLKYLPQIEFTIATHLIHLLHELGELDAKEGIDGFIYFSGEDALKVVATSSSPASVPLSIRNRFLLEYSKKLTDPEESEDPSRYVFIAIQYLTHILQTNNGTCPQASTKLESLLLNEIPFTQNPRLFRKLVSIAQTAGLDTVVSGLYNKYAEYKSKEEGREGESIAAYVSANQIPRANHIAERLLKSHLSHPSSPTTRQIITQLSSTVLSSSPFVAVLSKLVSFQEFYESQVWNECGAALLELLTRLPTPKWVWGRLLVDSVGILEGDSLVFGVDETYELMRCLEEVSGSGICQWEGKGVVSEGKKKVGDDMETDEDGVEVVSVEAVRLALSRNLARAMMARF